jgi:hypothetical protein
MRTKGKRNPDPGQTEAANFERESKRWRDILLRECLLVFLPN